MKVHSRYNCSLLCAQSTVPFAQHTLKVRLRGRCIELIAFRGRAAFRRFVVAMVEVKRSSMVTIVGIPIAQLAVRKGARAVRPSEPANLSRDSGLIPICSIPIAQLCLTPHLGRID